MSEDDREVTEGGCTPRLESSKVGAVSVAVMVFNILAPGENFRYFPVCRGRYCVCQEVQVTCFLCTYLLLTMVFVRFVLVITIVKAFLMLTVQ